MSIDIDKERATAGAEFDALAAKDAAIVSPIKGWGLRHAYVEGAIAAAKRATQPAPIPAQTSFDAAWNSIDWDVWRMQPIRELVRHLHGLTAGNALTDEAKDAAHKVAEHLKSARDALQRLEATLSVLHEDRDPIMAATITSVALVLDSDIEAAREAIDAAIAAHIKAGQAGKEKP